MVTTFVLIGAVLVATVCQLAIIERRSRLRQWELVGRALRTADRRMRGAGWTLSSVTFRPGFRRGLGEAIWSRGEERWVAPLEVDAIATTREAAKPW